MKFRDLTENKKRGSLAISRVETFTLKLIRLGAIYQTDEDEHQKTIWYGVSHDFVLRYDGTSNTDILINFKDNNSWVFTTDETGRTGIKLTDEKLKDFELYKLQKIELDNVK